MKYDIVDLKLLVAVADTGNLTAGSALCFLSPSAASLRIKSLEDVMGTLLFERHARGVRLTAAGSAMLGYARACLQVLDRMHGELNHFAQGVKGHVRVASNWILASTSLVDDINPFLMAHPGIRISIEEGRTHDILVAVNSGKADIGIVVPKLSSERLHFQEYREEEVVFIVSQDHPLATHEEASLMDVLSHPIVTLGPSSPMHACISDKAAAVGRTLNVRAHVTNFRAVVQMARAANVVGIVPLSVLKDVVHDDLRIIKTADIWPRGRMQVCIDQSSVGTNHAAWLLFKHLRECAIHAS